MNAMQGGSTKCVPGGDQTMWTVAKGQYAESRDTHVAIAGEWTWGRLGRRRTLMQHSGFRSAALGVAVAVVAIACGSSGSDSTATGQGGSYQGKTIQFGAVFSLSGVGGIYGPPSKNGVDLAVETINKSGGVKGAKFAFDIQDDASDKQQAAQVTQRLMQEKQVYALLGPTLSNSAVAAHPIADSGKTPMLAVSNTGAHIVGDCPYPCTYIFRDSQGEAAAYAANIKAYAEKLHPKTGVLLYPNDDKFSVDGADVVKANAPKYGINLLDSIQFTKDESDLSPYITRAVQKNPEVIFITSVGPIPAKIMIGARAQGFKGQFLGGNGFNSPAVSKQAGIAGKGAQSASAWYIGNDFKANADFVRAYRARFNVDPDQFAAQSYTGVLILADSAKRAAFTFSDLAGDRNRLKAAMEKTSIDTPLGAFQFTKDHDVKSTVWIIAMDGNGGFTFVTSVKPA